MSRLEDPQFSPGCMLAMVKVHTQCSYPAALFARFGATSGMEMLSIVSQVDLREVCRYAISDNWRLHSLILFIDSRRKLLPCSEHSMQSLACSYSGASSPMKYPRVLHKEICFCSRLYRRWCTLQLISAAFWLAHKFIRWLSRFRIRSKPYRKKYAERHTGKMSRYKWTYDANINTANSDVINFPVGHSVLWRCLRYWLCHQMLHTAFHFLSENCGRCILISTSDWYHIQQLNASVNPLKQLFSQNRLVFAR
jgi:hypothetical protein